MGRGGRGGNQHNNRRPVDLTGVISVAERNDLSTLISAITDKIHNGISNIFDSPPVSPVQDDTNQHHWLALSLKDRDQKEYRKSASQLGSGSTPSEPNDELIEHNDTDDPVDMAPQLQELRKEALVSFRKWQATVLQRVRDISVTETSNPQLSFRGRGRGARGVRGGRGGRGSRGGRGGLTLATGPLRPVSNHLDRELARRYPPIPTTLWSLPLEKRKTLFHSAHLLLLSLQEYNSYTRLLLLYLTSSLNLLSKFFREEETRIAQGLSRVALDAYTESILDQKQDENKGPRRPKPKQLNSVTPGKLADALIEVGIGTTHQGHGLEPAAAAGLLGAMADNGLASGPIFGIYVARPTSKMIESCAREIQDFGLIPVRDGFPGDYVDARKTPAKDRRLRVVIGINGWLVDEHAITQPWRFLGSHAEVFSLRWDVTILSNLGGALKTVTKSTAWSTSKKEITSQTIFSNLIDATWPTGLMKISKIIDNPWSLGMVRAEKAGTVLADALMRNKVHGDRPISLVGYSLGARAIYICLMVLAERRQFGLIESVVLMGTPAPSESRVWLTLKSVVAGRLINVYSENDYLLGFLYRTSNIHFGVAGLQQIRGADGVENHDVSRLITEHLRYAVLAGKILKDVGWEDMDMAAMKADRLSRTSKN